MGRHSRKGPQAKGPEAETVAGTGDAPGAGRGRRRRAAAVQPAGDGHGPFHDIPQARGGHPEQREPGGGWGTGPQPRYGEGQRPGLPDAAPQAYAQVARQVPARPAAQRAAEQRATGRPSASDGPPIPGPRREFIEAFDAAAPTSPAGPFGPAAHPGGTRPDPAGDAGGAGYPDDPAGPGYPDGLHGSGDSGGPASPAHRGSKGRTFTGIAAAAVTTVLAVVVAGQVAQDSDDASGGSSQAAGVDRGDAGDASRSDERPTPQAQDAQVKPLSYEDRLAKPYPLAPGLTASGKFEAVPGLAKAPGKGEKYRYRVDIEKGLGLDGGLFAEAVQKTLNDDRSWAHNGAMTFERISSGEADFVITLASPGTTGVWCEKSGLDTTEDNVSCDSAATDRIMINAYRWAQGASTFGPKRLLAYRQMLINHEVGHRLGYDHVSCRTPGALAPVMQQQTKTLELEGIKCRPNAWVFPDR